MTEPTGQGHDLGTYDVLAISRFTIQYAHAHLDQFQSWLAASHPDALPLGMCEIAEADAQLHAMLKPLDDETRGTQ